MQKGATVFRNFAIVAHTSDWFNQPWLYLQNTQLKLALYLKTNAVLSGSLSLHGIEITHMCVTCVIREFPSWVKGL